MQRDEAAHRGEVEWQPRFFRRVRGDAGSSEDGEEGLDWILKANINGKTAQEQISQILSTAPILPARLMPGGAGQAALAQQDGSGISQIAHSTASMNSPSRPEGIGMTKVARQDSLAGDGGEVEEFVDARP